MVGAVIWDDGEITPLGVLPGGALDVNGRRWLYGKAGSGAGTPGASGVRAVLSNIATIV